MKGYKMLNKDMRAANGNYMQYELNKIYELKGKIIPCENGYHFCKNIEDTLVWYNIFENNRLFEVEALGDIVNKYDRKLVTDKIKLVREISAEEIRKYIENNINKLINDENYCVRCEVARQGYGLDILINDEDYDVRCEVARQGYGLDILINDKSCDVRYEVARQGYGLDILINDEDYVVRCEVARQGYGLDILINDKSWSVRCEVARQGYGLDILINDEDYDVRCEVARQGYGLDILINDKSWRVRCEVRKQVLNNKQEEI